MESGTEKRCLAPTIIDIDAFCLFFRGVKLKSPAIYEAGIQTGLNSLIFVVPNRPDGDGYGGAI